MAEGLNPELQRRFNLLAAAARKAGHNIGIGSGYRTVQEQINLRRAHCGSSSYDIWQKPASQCSPPTAIPGKSNHNHGLAIDFTGDEAADAWVTANAARFGLSQPVPGEVWHLEMGDDAKSNAAISAAQEAGAIGFDLDWMEKENPEDELANRLHSIMRIAGMADVQTELPQDLMGLEGTDVGQENFNVPGEVPANELGIMPASETGQAGPAAGAGSPVTGQSAAGYQAYARAQLKKYGWNENEIGSLIDLWNRESNWNPNAQNPTSTAYGIAQFLNGTWAGTGIGKTSNPYRQIDAGLAYIKARYKTPSAALSFHDRNNWY